MKRAQTFQVAIANNANEQTFTPTFNDKNKAQSFTSVFVGINTKGILLKIIANGRTIASFDCSMFLTTDSRGHFEVVMPPQDQLTYSFTDPSGTGNALVPVTFFYDIPAGSDTTA